MSLLRKYKEDTYQWGIWKTEESTEELLSLLPDSKRYEQQLSRFSSPRRKLEWLSVRVLLYQLLGEEKRIEYAPSGKPRLADSSYFISISHTRGYVAVILSSVSEVGVDIEQYGLKVHKVAHKYMRADEIPSEYQETNTWSLLLHWSAKEVMFKCMDTSEVDFREHLRVSPFQVCEYGEFLAEEYRTDQKKKFIIRYLLHPDFVMTWQVDSVYQQKCPDEVTSAGHAK